VYFTSTSLSDGEDPSKRHDRNAKYPDDTTNPALLSGYDSIVGILNSRARGNVCFCDGHGEYVTREYLHLESLHHWDPTY
jgi:prepilin-type processing-associated H-X9-DG protein